MMCLRLVSALLLVVSAHGFCNTMHGAKMCERYVGRFDVTCTVLGPRPGLMSNEACHALCEADGRQGCCENNINSNCQMCLPSSGALDRDHDGVAQTLQYAAVCSSCEAGTTGISGSTECFAPKQQEASGWIYSSDTVVGYGRPASSIMYGSGPGLVGHLNNDLTVSVDFGQPEKICGVYTDTTKAFTVQYQDATGNFIEAATFPDASGTDATLNFAAFESQVGKLMWIGADSTSGTSGFHAEFMLCPPGTVVTTTPVYCKSYTCTGDTLLKSDAATIIGGDDVTCCDDWTTTFAACTIGDQKAKCPNDPAKCVSDLTSDELISVCGEFKKKGSPCDTDPLALQSLSAPCATCKAYTCSAGALLSNAAMLTGADDATCCDDTDIAGGSTTLSASILAFVGSFVILLA